MICTLKRRWRAQLDSIEEGRDYGHVPGPRCLRRWIVIYRVIVGVALRRPPREDEFRLTVVEADNPTEAKLIAAQIAACTSVMPVSTVLDENLSYPTRILDRCPAWH